MKTKFSLLDIYKKAIDNVEESIENIRSFDVVYGQDEVGFTDVPAKLVVTYYDYSVYEYPIVSYQQKLAAVTAVNQMLKRW